MKDLIRIILEGSFKNLKKILFASNRVTDMEMRENILQGKVKLTDKVAIDACIGCSGCANVCPTGAVTMTDLESSKELMEGWTKNQIPELDSEKCIFCYYCHDFCPVYALFGEKGTIHPNDVGKVDLNLEKNIKKPFKISEDKLSFISQYLSDKTILRNNNENKVEKLHKFSK